MKLNSQNAISIGIGATGSLPDTTLQAICRLAAAGFEQPDDEAMQADTIRHIEGAEDAVIAMLGSKAVGFALFGHSLGGKALELTGTVVLPDMQAHGIGPKMLRTYLRGSGAEFLTAHTRNPAILKMIGRVCGFDAVYPVNRFSDLAGLALQIPGSTKADDGIVYHVNRYGESGLYGRHDPADRPVNASGRPLRSYYPGLKLPGTALVVVAKIPEALTK